MTHISSPFSAPAPSVVGEVETRHRENGGKVSRYRNSGYPWQMPPKSIRQPSPVGRQSIRRDFGGRYDYRMKEGKRKIG